VFLGLVGYHPEARGPVTASEKVACFRAVALAGRAKRALKASLRRVPFLRQLRRRLRTAHRRTAGAGFRSPTKWRTAKNRQLDEPNRLGWLARMVRGTERGRA
jgi:hypothetical protein